MREELRMFWICPKCKTKVAFEKQMSEVFDENREADFDPKNGLWFHSIDCEQLDCGATWTVSISKMQQE